MRAGFLALGAIAALVGCGGASDEGQGAPLDEGWEASPARTEDLAAQAAATGAYDLQTTVDLTALAFAPASAADPYRALHGLKDDPSATLFAVAGEAGVPMASSLHDALPSPVRGELNGWINDAIRSAGGGSFDANLQVLVAAGDTTLLRFNLLTELDLSRDAGGDELATHRLRGIQFGFGEGKIPVQIARITDKAGITEARPTMKIGAAHSDGSSRAALGDHSFGLPLGQYAFAGLNELSKARYGAELRPALGAMVDCGRMAHTVASKCIDLPWPADEVCVGHESDLREICERGLDEVVRRVQDRLNALDIEAIQLERGDAQLIDATRDGSVEAIQAGVWKARVNLGQGPREVKAVFSGTRTQR